MIQHRRLFTILRPCHMSGDETDGEMKQHFPKFRIIASRWQSLALRTFLWALDAIYRDMWAAPIGKRATAGNPPRYRIPDEREPSPEEDKSIAPIGLWRNCYDPDFLASLKPHVRASLHIIDSDYDFSLEPVSEGKGKQKAT